MPPISELAGFAFALVGAGIVAGYLAGLFGIGGGAVLVPVFYQVFGLIGVDDAVRMHVCVASSVAVIVPTSLRSFLSHNRLGAADTELLKGWLLAIPAGAILASIVAAATSSSTLRLIFAILTLLVGLRMLFNRETWRLGQNLPPQPYLALVGALIGFLSALMGIGGGVLNNTFMTLFGRPVHQAVATSAGVGALIAIPALFGYIVTGWGEPGLPPFSTGFVNWIAVALIIPVTFLAAPLGVKTAHALSRRKLEVALGIFLMLVGIQFIYGLVKG